METQAEDIHLSLGLSDVETNLSTCLSLWDELQSSSVEAAQTPEPSIFKFAESCFLFAVVMKPVDEKDSNDVHEEFPDSGHQWATDLSGARHVLEPCDANPRPYASSTFLSPPPSNKPKAPMESAIGLVYCMESPNLHSPPGEVNVGVIIHRRFRGRGYARQAVELILKFVFGVLNYHRVQAALMDTFTKDRALILFTQLGFGHEGVRRRSAFSASEGEWKDVTYLAVLDTEWSVRRYFKRAPKSMWDELFARHDRERQELLQWEEKKALKRCSSTETVRQGSPDTSQRTTFASDEEHLLGTELMDPLPEDNFSQPSPPPSDSDCADDSIYDDEPYSFTPGLRFRDADAESASSISSSQSPASSESGSLGSPSGSQWDMLETSSESERSSSTFEDLHDSDFE